MIDAQAVHVRERAIEKLQGGRLADRYEQMRRLVYRHPGLILPALNVYKAEASDAEAVKIVKDGLSEQAKVIRQAMLEARFYYVPVNIHAYTLAGNKHSSQKALYVAGKDIVGGTALLWISRDNRFMPEHDETALPERIVERDTRAYRLMHTVTSFVEDWDLRLS